MQGLSPTDLLLCYDLVAACLTEILAWGGWLRASELFNLTVKDITVCLPENGARHNLPPGVGGLFLKLLPTTKSSQFTTADVILASSFSSGLSPLFWWQQTLALLATLGWNQPDSFVFRHTLGSHGTVLSSVTNTFILSFASNSWKGIMLYRLLMMSQATLLQINFTLSTPTAEEVELMSPAIVRCVVVQLEKPK